VLDEVPQNDIQHLLASKVANNLKALKVTTRLDDELEKLSGFSTAFAKTSSNWFNWSI
jgi:hypothetical protein